MAEKWHVVFDPTECGVMHFGRMNVRRMYTVNGKTLNGINMQRDLGAQIHSSVKMAAHVDRVVKKTYGMHAFIDAGIVYKSQEVLMQLLWILVRQHLQYCMPF